MTTLTSPDLTRAIVQECAPAPDFSRLAGLYRWMELFSFGPWLQRCRCAFLSEIGLCRKGLVLGDGDGRFTARLLKSNSVIHVDAVDASHAMLRALLQRAVPDPARVRTHCADIRQWKPAESAPADPAYDLIVTHFFLDCITTDEVSGLAARVRKSVSSSAIWLVSDFSISAGWFGRMIARPVVKGLYFVFGWLTGLNVRALPDHRTALAGCGFRLELRRSFLGGLLVSEMWRADSARNG